ncbi:MAG: family 4 glycosyl hydrolase [Armatimonadota bacterium]
MRDGITICVVGAGSSYTPELIEEIINLPERDLPISSVRLTDVDPARLGIMTGLAERMVRHAGKKIVITAGPDLRVMLDGADFVITQIRVGGMQARYLDESIPLKYGIIGQETTGPGGMCKALRTIPAMLEIARTVYEVAPQAFILNYTNPSGIITEAVRKYANLRLLGLCAGIPGIQEDLRQRLSPRYPDLRTYTVGLNHLGFVHRIFSEDREVTQEALEWLNADTDAAATDHIALSQFVQAVPISYLGYYLHRGSKVELVKNLPQTRAQVIEELERDLFAEAADPKTITKPAILAKRGGGGYAGITFTVMKAIYGNTGEEITVNVPNQGAVDGIDDDAVVEVVCTVDRRGATPLPVGPIPLAFRGLVHAVKAYETLTVEAAMQRSKRLARQALLNHPLVGDLDLIEPLLNEMLQAHGLHFSDE